MSSDTPFEAPEFLKKRREIRTLRLSSSEFPEVEAELKRASLFHCRRSSSLVGYKLVDGVVELELEMEPGRLLPEEIEHRKAPLNAVETLRLGRELLLAQIEARQSGYLFSRITPRHVLLRVEDEGREITGGAKLIFPPMPEGDWWVSANNTAYVSPEEFKALEGIDDASCDYRSTIFSIGAVLFYALTGKDPRKLLSGAISWEDEALEDLPSGFQELLSKMTSAVPAKRCGSIDDLAHEFTGLLREQSNVDSGRGGRQGLVEWTVSTVNWIRRTAAL